MKKLMFDPAKVSNDFKKLNPHLFGMGQLPGAQPKPVIRPALDPPPQGYSPRQRRLAGGRPIVRVHIIAFRRRALDRDNLIGGYKHLRDAIARWLTLDDAESCIDWQYDQIETSGQEGTAVKIEIL